MPIIANIHQFLTDILSSPDFHIPIEANFVVGFDNLNGIIKNLSTSTVPDKVTTTAGVWGTLNSNDIFFANGVTIPGETTTSARAGYSSAADGLYGGLLSGPVLTGRSNLTNFEITFLETNRSFADQIIRPWIINAAHYGLFARDDRTPAQNFKTDITVGFIDKRSSDSNNPVNRKTILFKNAVPLSVEQSTASYSGSRVTARNVKTTWIYSTYEIS